MIAPSTNPLAELQRRLAVVRARILAVTHHHANGFYLFGRAGTSKTHTIRTTLAEFGKPKDNRFIEALSTSVYTSTPDDAQGKAARGNEKAGLL